MQKLTVVAESPNARAHLPYLRRMVRRVLPTVAPDLQDLSIALVGDRRMAALHEQFTQITGPTDVLTFELDHDRRKRVTSGEIVICVPYARRAAAAAGTDLRRELLLYAIHGMLHLAGHEDRTRRGFERMHRAEDRILTELGVGPVFRPTAEGGSPRSRARRAPAGRGPRRHEGMGRR